MTQNTMLDFGAGPGDMMGGAMISGKWINKNNGNVINVRDSFIDDSQNMFLLTDKGQISMDEFTKYYIQASDEVYDLEGHVVDTKPVDTTEVSVAASEDTLVADPIFPGIMQGSSIQIQKQINNFELIDKIFKKNESKPTIDLKINWADFPKKELSMLIEYFDVKNEDIASYISEYLVNSDLLEASLTEWLDKNLSSIGK